MIETRVERVGGGDAIRPLKNGGEIKNKNEFESHFQFYT